MSRHAAAGPPLLGTGEWLQQPTSERWLPFRACPVCKRPMGMACIARSGRVVNGRPDGKVVELEVPHQARKRRTGR